MTSEQTIVDLLGAASADATALVEPDAHTRMSYAEFQADVNGLARALSARGVAHGDRVAIVVRDGPQFLRCLLAVVSVGAAAAPLNPAYTSEEFAFYLDDLAPRLVLSREGDASAARLGAHGVEFLYVDGLAVPPEGEPRSIASPDDVALVLHTSGTTSSPKQVQLLQRNLVANARAIAQFYELSPTDVSFCVMPLFHVHGLVASVLAQWAAGGNVVVPSRFAPGRFLRNAREHGATWFSAGPTLHAMILDKHDGERIDMLRFVRSCSSALPAELFSRLESTYGVPVLEAYGMTEASHQISSNPLPPGRRAAGSVGVPLPGVDIRVVNTDGRDTAVGEVAIRGPGLTPGYAANPRANAESFFDGWFRTGDLGRFGDDGYLVLDGRLKELIIRGGENISPFEIEAALKAHPAVADSVAFGIPDDRYGEEVGAAVVLRGDADENSLRDWCSTRLAAFKVPKRIFVLDSIPRTPTGKLQRARIGSSLVGGS
jgi:acyl-CoA synthetase (AMP-forming)/AMP-acid ligase II